MIASITALVLAALCIFLYFGLTALSKREGNGKDSADSSIAFIDDANRSVFPLGAERREKI